MLGVWLALCAFGTAVLSGVFGMAGGILLMGAYVALLPVAAAMVLHGATQLFANALRAAILWRHVYWRGLNVYVAGAAATFGLLLYVRYVPNQLVVFLGIGLAPFVSLLLPRGWLAFERPHAALITGIQVTALNLTAGAAGPLLDVAFVDTALNKRQVVATKAISQVFSHTLKLAYFAPLVSSSELPSGMLAAILVATVLGTLTGTRILARLSDQRFKSLSRSLVYGIGLVYLCRAATL